MFVSHFISVLHICISCSVFFYRELFAIFLVYCCWHQVY